MSSPAAANKSNIPKTIWDLIFTLLIPIGILSPNLLGSGFSFSEVVFGGGAQGNIHAYLLAAVVPVAYVVVDLLINKSVSAIALMGGAVALVRGALAFWYVDGLTFALKDSVPSLLFGLLALGSLATKTPLFRILLDTTTLAEDPAHRAATQRALAEPNVSAALRQATLAYAISELISTLLHFLFNLKIVVAKFGTDAFNTQVAESHAAVRIPGMILSFIGVGIGFWLVQRALKQRYGQEADLFAPEKLAELQRQ